jgi:hypothetical protein
VDGGPSSTNTVPSTMRMPPVVEQTAHQRRRERRCVTRLACFPAKTAQAAPCSPHVCPTVLSPPGAQMPPGLGTTGSTSTRSPSSSTVARRKTALEGSSGRQWLWPHGDGEGSRYDVHGPKVSARCMSAPGGAYFDLWWRCRGRGSWSPIPAAPIDTCASPGTPTRPPSFSVIGPGGYAGRRPPWHRLILSKSSTCL